MNKDEIIAALVAKGIAHDPKDTKAILLALLPEDDNQEKPVKTVKTVKVTAARNLTEVTGYHKKGETFETTPARAKALGKLVTKASD